MRHTKGMMRALGVTLVAGAAACSSGGAETAGAGDTAAGAAPATTQAAGGPITGRMSGWHEASQKAAAMMVEKYGQPAEETATMLVWHNAGPWKRTVISKEAVQHDFPMPHPDVMEQVINYEVPADKFDELAAYDGSVIVERTKGEISARCDKEAANFLALNLAHDIVTGKQTVAGARQEYAAQIKAMMAKQPAPYTEGLKFDVPTRNVGFSDEPAPGMRKGM